MRRNLTIVVLEDGKEIAKREVSIPDDATNYKDESVPLNQLVIQCANKNSDIIHSSLGLINI
jgi:hypothetical protein